MSEFQAFAQLRNLGVHVTHNPAGTYSFVGSGIPAALAYVATDGGPADPEDIEKGRKHGFGFVKTIKKRVFQTREDAWQAAREFNISPCSCCK